MKIREAGIALLLLAGLSAAQVTPLRDREEIIRYAKSAIGCPYIMGGSKWDPADKKWGGTDCSGLVGKAWAIAHWVPYRQPYHPYATVHLIQTPGSHWREVSLKSLVTGDACVYRYPRNNGGHTYIFEAGDGWGSHLIIEAGGRSVGVVYRWRQPPSSYYKYKGIRRTRLIENKGVSDIVVESDDGAPSFTYFGSSKTSSVDSYAHFLHDGRCLYNRVVSGSADRAVFAPNLPQAGPYKIFVTCNQASPNVAGVKVTLYHAAGSRTWTWDQGRLGLNQWLYLVGIWNLRKGRADKVVWEDSSATPRDGTHLFRADATMFRLSNEVIVDGMGGAPGRFATIGQALSWLRSHRSLDRDRIRITTDKVVEMGPLDVDLLDDLVIEGDADGNGKPCTVVIPPGPCGKWSVKTGIYLEIPIQRNWTLKDLTIVPVYKGPGVKTGAVALAVDSLASARTHNGFTLNLERVTLTGSLSGDLPARADRDERARCTRWGGGSGAERGVLVLRAVSSAGDGNWQTLKTRGLTVSQGDGPGVALNAACTQVRIEGRTLVSYNDGEGIAYRSGLHSYLVINGGPGSERVVVAHNKRSGILVDAPYAPASRVTISGCLVHHNGSASTDAGLLTLSPAGLVKDSLFAFNTRYNWYHRAPGTSSSPLAVRAERCTFHDARYSAGDTSPVCVSSLADYNRMTFRDCIFTGPPAAGRLEAIYVADSAQGTTVLLDHCALVTQGPHALSGNGIRNGASKVTLSWVIPYDPAYVSLDPASPKFLDVSSPLYGKAGTGGNPLAGGASYSYHVQVKNYGKGCSGGGGYVPAILSFGGDPLPGNKNFAIWLMLAQPGSAAVLAAGPSKSYAPSLGVNLPFSLAPFGRADCSLLTDFFPFGPALAVGGTGSGGGSAHMPLPIPNDPVLLAGAKLYFQWILLDPKAKAGLCVSPGLEILWP